jgi:hypothetical protein
VDQSIEEMLGTFRSLDLRKGFFGIVLDGKRCLQFLPKPKGVRIELLDSSISAFDSCIADAQFAENLLQAAALGKDCFRIARETDYTWERTKL